ncbi:hypothetical protein QAD02_021770 [Eretmocerus hayati]|uniref:Uncharacterized protein n=1 Tax=Eretmocerus hayati TaxID=131215 RepID=A0ACC2PUC7_9HYME|nr:hypothetical protein QAD02_021770 [Eretmocerus hayati]
MIKSSVCQTISEQWPPQDCKKCPKSSGITSGRIDIPEDRDSGRVEFAASNRSDSEKRSHSVSIFEQEFAESGVKCGPHLGMKKIQQKAVSDDERMTLNKSEIDFTSRWFC